MKTPTPELPAKLRDAGYLMRLVFNDDNTSTLRAINVNSGESYIVTAPGVGKQCVEELARQAGVE